MSAPLFVVFPHACLRPPMRASLPLLLTALLLPAVGCTDADDTSPTTDSEPSPTIPFDKEGRLAFQADADTLVVIDIEVADTDSAQKRGMMQRDGFPSETSGMLFPYQKEKERNFWMANTPVPLDLFFVDADSQIVNIAKYAQPNTADRIASDEKAQYVLETPAGFADSYGIVEGHRLRWKRTDDGS